MDFNTLHPAVQITAIICGTALACVAIYQFWKTIREQ